MADFCYFSARKLSSSRGGGICTDSMEIFKELEAFIPLYEGFLTYGGMSIREVEGHGSGIVRNFRRMKLLALKSYIY